MNGQRERFDRWLTLAGALALVGFLAVNSTRLLAQGKEADFRPQKLLDPLPPITKFPTKTVREAKDEINPTELVIGVTVGKESRSYPINMLTGPRREILNDELGGKAIAATW